MSEYKPNWHENLKFLAEMQKKNPELREIISDICNKYEIEIEAKYAGTLNFPCRQRDYDSDMDVINRARNILSIPKGEN